MRVYVLCALLYYYYYYYCIFFSIDIKNSLWIKNYLFDDVDITDNVIVFLSDVTTKIHCGIQCATTPRCVSFSYDAELKCRLHSARFESNTTYLPSLGSRHYSLAKGNSSYIELSEMGSKLSVVLSNRRFTLSEIRHLHYYEFLFYFYFYFYF